MVVHCIRFLLHRLPEFYFVHKRRNMRKRITIKVLSILQVLLKRGVSKMDVRARLKEVFQDSSVDVWDCTLV